MIKQLSGVKYPTFMLFLVCFNTETTTESNITIPASENNTWRCHRDEDCGEPFGIGKCNLTSGVCRCVLSECHNYDNSTNTCVLKQCRVLEIEDNKIGCIDRGTRNKETAMYLTIISITGAQNFYLKNWAQAIPQLIGFLVILTTCGGCLCSFGSFCKKVMRKDFDYDEIKNNITRGCFCQVLAIMIALAELAWMMADFIMIGLDGKLDGDGCLLDDGTVERIQEIAIGAASIGGGCR